MKYELIQQGEMERDGYIFRTGLLFPYIGVGLKRQRDLGSFYRQLGIKAPTKFMYTETAKGIDITLQILGFGIYWTILVRRDDVIQ